MGVGLFIKGRMLMITSFFGLSPQMQMRNILRSWGQLIAGLYGGIKLIVRIKNYFWII